MKKNYVSGKTHLRMATHRFTHSHPEGSFGKNLEYLPMGKNPMRNAKKL